MGHAVCDIAQKRVQIYALFFFPAIIPQYFFIIKILFSYIQQYTFPLGKQDFNAIGFGKNDLIIFDVYGHMSMAR